MGPLCAVLLWYVTSVVSEQSETSLRVFDAGLKVKQQLVLACGGRGNTTHALAGASWLQIGVLEKQLFGNGDGTLKLDLRASDNGTRVVCRSHSRSPRIASVSDAFHIHVEDVEVETKQTHIQMVMSIGNNTYAEGGQINRTVGSEINVLCEGRNIPTNVKLYTYILQRNGSEETEIAGVINGSRLATVSTKFKLSYADHSTRLYCLARWFRSELYNDAIAARSEPVTIIIDRSGNESGLYIWIAIGVGSLGWLAAALLLGALCYFKRAAKTPKDSSEELCSGGGTVPVCSCASAIYSEPELLGASVVPANSARELLGASVVPVKSARELLAANRKRASAARREHEHEPVAYSNLEAIALTKKRYF